MVSSLLEEWMKLPGSVDISIRPATIAVNRGREAFVTADTDDNDFPFISTSGNEGKYPGEITVIDSAKSSGVQEPLRVGEIPYLNMFPLFMSLKQYFDLRDLELIPGHPAELNLKLRKNLVDISPSSSIEYARTHENYYLIPDISVSSRRKVKSVILFSPFTLEKNNDFPVFVTPHSDTSIILLKIILQEFLGKKTQLHLETDPKGKAAVEKSPYLLIGDEAIRESLCGENMIQYDLGKMWAEYTGMPFVFALWMVNAKAYREKRSAVKKFARKLLDAKKIAISLIRFRNEKMLAKDDYPWGFLNDYWTNLSYDLEGEMEGLIRFYEISVKIGVIKDLPEVKFIELM